ncbi:MAG TPA: Crp/Fnr family transcriptional regulator [Actinomycetota bacterium]|nr:Crp/Fnr family transcriptional regulator [Actinomycetota bacterium]
MGPRGSMLRHAAWIARSVGRGDLFPFTPADVAELAESIGVARLEAGTRLLAPGGPVEWIGIIERGEVELSHRSGIRRVVLQILRDGDLLGDVPFFCRLPSPFTARTLTDVMLIRLERVDVERLLATRPMLAQRFLYSLASRLERMQRRLLQLTGGDLRAQVAALLRDETEEGADLVRLPQATLAELLGARRPSVNRALKDLESRGVVRLGYRRIEIVDASALARVAGT